MPIKVGLPSDVSDRWIKADHAEHLTAFLEPVLVEDVATTYGRSDAARCDVLCITCGEHFADQMVFGAALVPKLTGGGDQVVAGVLTTGVPRPGQSPPWIIDPPNREQLAHVRAVVDAAVSEGEDGTLVVDTAGLAALDAWHDEPGSQPDEAPF